MKDIWLQNRYNWLNSESFRPLEPDWGMLSAAKTLQDLLEWDYCKSLKDAGDEDLELEFDDLSGGLEQFAEDKYLVVFGCLVACLSGLWELLCVFVCLSRTIMLRAMVQR